MTTSFSIIRILHLIKNEFWIKWKLYTILFVIAILASVMVYYTPSHDISELQSFSGTTQSTRTIIDSNGGVSTYYNGFSVSSLKYHFNWFPQLLFTIGCIFASLTFWEYRPGNSRSFHLNLPAMKVEKWIAKVIITLVLFPLIFLILYQLYASITYALGPDQGIEFVRIAWLDPYIWKYIGYYVIVQSFFVLGAIYFTKYSAIISLLVLTSLVVSKKLIIAFGHYSKTGEFDSPWAASSNLLNFSGQQTSSLNQGLIYIFNQKTWPQSVWIWGILFIALAMLIVYYRFQELES